MWIVAQDVGTPVVKQLDIDRFAFVLGESADWYLSRIPKGKQVAVPYPTSPPRELVRRVLASPDLPLPALRRLSTIPTLRPDGTVNSRPGFDASTGTYLWPVGDMPDIPEHPTGAERARARALILDELLVDFPFVSPADLCNAVAALLTPAVAPAVDGVAPMFPIDAVRMGSGKGYLAQGLGIVTTGAEPGLTTPPKTDAEWRYSLLTTARAGHAVLMFDEAHELGSPDLSAFITSTAMSGRVVGTSTEGSGRRPDLILSAGNNVTYLRDMPRRVAPIRLDAGVVDPSSRTGFRHNPFIPWVKAERLELQWAVLVLCRA